MKDLTHYLDNSSKISEASNKTEKESINIVNDDDIKERQHLHTGRTSEKIGDELFKSDQTISCNIGKNYPESVDKKLSSCSKKRKRTLTDEVHTKTTKQLQVLDEKSRIKKEESGQFLDSLHETNSIKIAAIQETSIEENSKIDRNLINSKRKEDLENPQENVVESANARGYQKKKKGMDQILKKVDEHGNKNRKIFKKEISGKMSSQNDSKISTQVTVKQSENLFNYFSKATPEQLQKEKLLKTKVTVRAEIHSSQNSSIKNNNRASLLSRKQESDQNERYSQNFDEIHVIKSEAVTLSSKIDGKKSCSSQKKPKWTMKIQLEPDIKMHPRHVDNDSEEHTSTKMICIEKNTSTVLSVQMKNTFRESDRITAVETIVEETEQSKTNKIDDMHLKKKSRQDSKDCQILQDFSFEKKAYGKLAPLFLKKVEPGISAAHHTLLKSDINEEKLNLCKKLSPLASLILPFPRIGHINHYISRDDIAEHCISCFNTIENHQVEINSFSYKSVKNINISEPSLEPRFQCVQAEIDESIRKIESYCPDVNILWKYVSGHNKMKFPEDALEPKSIKFRRKSIGNCYYEGDNYAQNNLWTDKYKPNSCNQVVGNEEAAIKLKTWLDSWKFSTHNVNYSSSEEFHTSDCSSSSFTSNNQVAILTGPTGSGKTACVYAVAKELGYNVLEINASSKRPGKVVLKEFEEATKSHRVKDSDVENYCNSKKKKVKHKISHNSLILLEDVDIIFEEDDGFMSAVSQLVFNTKIPIVMTLTGKCFHLSKLAPQQLKINFKPVKNNRARALLCLIVLAEMRCEIDSRCLEVLCQTGDFRKSLLQLQYIILSKKTSCPYSAFPAWQDMRTNIHEQAIKENHKSMGEDFYISGTMNMLDNILESTINFSIISELLDIKDPTCNELVTKFESSLSLSQSGLLYSSLTNNTFEIGHYISKKMRVYRSANTEKDDWGMKNSFSQQFQYKKQVHSGVSSALAQIVLNTLDQRIITIDYLPYIRTICRAEDIRYQLNNKRGNRFFHYFQSSRVSSVMMKSYNVMSLACGVLQEKTQSDEKI